MPTGLFRTVDVEVKGPPDVGVYPRYTVGMSPASGSITTTVGTETVSRGVPSQEEADSHSPTK